MAVLSKAARIAYAKGLVAAFPTGVLVDRDGRAASSEFRVAVDEVGDVANVDPVTGLDGTPEMIRLLDGNGAWYEIDLPPNWI